jgi:3-hydroxyisobutyrate dehydrogenase
MSTGPGTIGFIGLGNMGGHMAINLLKAGHEVAVFDVVPENVQRLTEQGGQPMETPAELAAACDTIITMLPSSPHVKEVYGKILPAVREGALLIDSSTIDPTSAREVATQAQEAGAEMVDAPVSGGVGGAEHGTLTFMVGGQDAVFGRAQPVLQAMGKNIVHCGDNGTGQVAKVANNLILGISMMAVSEGMNLGVKLGMDPAKLAGIINTSSGRCWSSDTYNPCPGVLPGVPASNDYQGGFGVDLMKKDLGLALMAAKDSNSALPLGSLTDQIYAEISKQGGGKKDFSYAYQHLAGRKFDDR